MLLAALVTAEVLLIEHVVLLDWRCLSWTLVCVPCAPGMLAETKVMKDILKHTLVKAAAAGLGYRLIS